MKEQRGFTLVEVLVVMTIIAVLSAILFPTFTKVREKAIQVSCQSNMHQLGVAFAQYTEDNDQHYPWCINGQPTAWGGQIYEYIHAKGIYQCPADATVTSGNNGLNSYGFNANIGLAASGYGVGYNNEQFSSPSSTVLLFEVVGVAPDVTLSDEGLRSSGYAAGYVTSAVGNGVGATPGGIYGQQYGNGIYATGPNLGGRGGFYGGKGVHTGGANYLAADGHGKWCRPEQVSTGAVGVLGKHQDETAPNTAAATDRLFLSNGSTSATLTFSPM